MLCAIKKSSIVWVRFSSESCFMARVEENRSERRAEIKKKVGKEEER